MHYTNILEAAIRYGGLHKVMLVRDRSPGERILVPWKNIVDQDVAAVDLILGEMAVAAYDSSQLVNDPQSSIDHFTYNNN